MINIGTGVARSGPMFNGLLQRQIHMAAEEASKEVATVGAAHLAGDLGAPPFKNPTGWYRDSIEAAKIGPFWMIHDNDVIYGEWLAGTSARNRTTRFKGYQHWRRAIAYTHRIAGPITARVIARVLGRMS